MKFSFTPFAKLAATAVIALSLGSCNRAEYAQLPKSSAYLGTQTSSHRAVAVAAPAAVATPVAPAPAAKQEIAAVPAPATPAAAVARAAVASPEAAPAVAAAATAIATPAAPKPGLLQTAIAKKIMHKTDRLVAKMQRADRSNTASTAKSGISGNVKLGIILMVIGAIIALLPGLFRILGLIIFIVGVLFLLLALLDMA